MQIIDIEFDDHGIRNLKGHAEKKNCAALYWKYCDKSDIEF